MSSSKGFYPTKIDLGSSLDMSKKRRRIVIDVDDDVDIDGLKQFMKARNWLCGKLFWSVLIAFALLATVYELYRTVSDYVNNPILTTYTVTFSSHLPFPDVVICPSNAVNKTRQDQLNLSPHFLGMLTEYQRFAGNGTENKLLSKRAYVWDKFSTIPAPVVGFGSAGQPPVLPEPDVKGVRNYFLSLGYDTDAFLQECAFNSDTFANCSDVAEAYVDKNYGKCFLFDARKLQWRQTAAGVGFSVVINVSTALYPSLDPALFDGVYVYVADHYEPSAPTKIFVSPGTYTQISLRRQEFSLLRVESGDSKQLCFEKRHEPKFRVMNASYTWELCKMDCVQQMVLEECDCLLLVDPRFLNATLLEERKNLNFCTPEILSSCVFEKVVKHMEEQTSYCYKQRCGVSCSMVDFETSVSSLKMPSQASTRLRDLEKDYIMLDIAYERMRTVVVNQAPSMTFDTFISNIGGEISLFFGCSLLALANALLWCMMYVRRKCGKE